MKNFKLGNEIVRKRLACAGTSLVIGTSMIGFTGCSEQNYKSQIVASNAKVTEVFEDNTRLDEAVENDVATYDGMSIIEASDKLEKGIYAIKKLERINFDEVEKLEKLSDKDYEKALNLSNEELDSLVDEYYTALDNPNSLLCEETKLRDIKLLDHIYKTNKTWVDENKNEVAKSLLLYSTKGVIAEEINLNAKDINLIEYPWGNSDSEMMVNIEDNSYKVRRNTEGIGEAINALYDLESKNEEEITYDDYLSIIDLAKKTTMLGIKIKKGNFLDSSEKILNEIDLEEASLKLKRTL